MPWQRLDEVSVVTFKCDSSFIGSPPHILPTKRKEENTEQNTEQFFFLILLSYIARRVISRSTCAASNYGWCDTQLALLYDIRRSRE